MITAIASICSSSGPFWPPQSDIELPVDYGTPQPAAGVATSVSNTSSMIPSARDALAAGVAAKALGISTADAKGGLAIAHDLGVTPTAALKGMKIANDLGVTPTQAARAGIAVAKAMK